MGKGEEGGMRKRRSGNPNRIFFFYEHFKKIVRSSIFLLTCLSGRDPEETKCQGFLRLLTGVTFFFFMIY